MCNITIKLVKLSNINTLTLMDDLVEAYGHWDFTVKKCKLGKVDGV